MQIQPPASTLMACPQGMEQETNYLAALGAAESYQIIGVRLQILYGGGTERDQLHLQEFAAGKHTLDFGNT